MALFGAALAIGIGAFVALRTPSVVSAVEPEKPKATATAAGTWTMFGGTLSRNMINLADKNIPDEWNVKAKKNVLWTVKLGSRAYGGPIVSDGKVLVGTNNEGNRDPAEKGDRGVLMCFDAKTGDFLWQDVHNKLESGQVNDWPREGVCSTPIVEDGKVYYVTNRCEVVCVELAGDAKTKKTKQLWHLDMMKTLGVFPHNMSAGCPLILGDILYTVTGNGVDEDHINLPSPDAPSFIAINKLTGKVIWKDNAPGKNVMHGQWSNPMAMEVDGKTQVVFPGGDGWLRAYEPKTGEPIWRFDANPKDSKYELGGKGTRSDFIGTPVAYKGKIFIGTGQDPEHFEGVGHLWCIDPVGKKGDISPDLIADGSKFPPKIKANPNSAVVWHYGGPVSKADADKENRDYYFGRTMSTCAIDDDVIYVAELAGYMHCVDAKTGKRFWTHDMKSQVWGSPLLVDGKIYIATEDGDVWIFKANKEKAEPKKIEMDSPIRSTPVVVEGIMYIMTESSLIAIGEKK